MRFASRRSRAHRRRSPRHGKRRRSATCSHYCSITVTVLKRLENQAARRRSSTASSARPFGSGVSEKADGPGLSRGRQRDQLEVTGTFFLVYPSSNTSDSLVTSAVTQCVAYPRRQRSDSFRCDVCSVWL